MLANRFRAAWNNHYYRTYFFWADLALLAVMVGLVLNWVLFS